MPLGPKVKAYETHREEVARRLRQSINPQETINNLGLEVSRYWFESFPNGQECCHCCRHGKIRFEESGNLRPVQRQRKRYSDEGQSRDGRPRGGQADWQTVEGNRMDGGTDGSGIVSAEWMANLMETERIEAVNADAGESALGLSVLHRKRLVNLIQNAYFNPLSASKFGDGLEHLIGNPMAASGKGNDKAEEKHVESVYVEQMEESDEVLPFFGRVVDESVTRNFLLPLGSAHGLCLFLDGTRMMSTERSDSCPAWIVERSAEAKPEEDVYPNPGKEEARKRVVAPTVVTHTIKSKDLSFCLKFNVIQYKLQFNKPVLEPNYSQPICSHLDLPLGRVTYAFKEAELASLQEDPRTEKKTKCFTLPF